MCGIAGILTLRRPVNAELVDAVLRMLNAQVRRGPNDWGILVPSRAMGDEAIRSLLGKYDPVHILAYDGPRSGPEAVLGCRRLSIIDLSPRGRMPMGTADRRLWIVFNGEIYNFRELRRDLVGRGYAFHSDTDTEVILHGYEEWGEDVVQYLRGMFAFGILDIRRPDDPKLFLAKDRFGIKPLYWAHKEGVLHFTSEVRALMASGLVPNEPEPRALHGFLVYGSVPTPFTTVRGVFSLPAAHTLTIDTSTPSRPKPRRYWSLPEAGSSKADPQEAEEKVRRLLEESVRMHLVSDVPLGVFLSGGTDSSAVTALAARNLPNPLTTLCVTFDEAEFNEGKYAAKVAEQFGCKHIEVRLRAKDFIEEIPRIISAMDQPSVDGVNTYFVAKAAREAGLTVVLSGLGGDEVFWGYPGFRTAPHLAQFSGLPGGRLVAAIAAASGRALGSDRLEKLEFIRDSRSLGPYLAVRGLFAPSRTASLLGLRRVPYSIIDPSRRYLTPSDYAGLEIALYLQNQLLRDTDVMSMAHSVEARVPFLDHELVEFVFRLPAKYKMSARVNKPLLVRTLGEEIPREISDRVKMGFTFPFELWVREHLDDLAAKSLKSETFEREEVAKVWEGFRDRRMSWSRPWATLVGGASLRRSPDQTHGLMPRELRVGVTNVLIYRTGQLGDTVCAIPAIQAIRDNLSPCDLTLLSDYHPGAAYPAAADILSQFGIIDDSIIYAPSPSLMISQALNLRREIQRRQIKSAYYLAPARRRFIQRLRDKLFFRWCGVREIHGLELDIPKPRVREVRQEADRLLDILRTAGLQVPSMAIYGLPISKTVCRRIDELWRSAGLAGRVVVAISPGSKMPAKRWGEDRYQEIGLRLTGSDDVRLVIVGGAEDKPLGERLCKAWDGRGVNLAGTTSYAESAEALRRCRLYVGNDNGAMHLAAAVGTPCVAIFSSRDEPGAWDPYGTGHTVFRRNVECQGCMLVDCVEQKMKCIRNITADEVFLACLRYLSPGP